MVSFILMSKVLEFGLMVTANEVLERAAGVGLSANMILYLTKEYHWENATGASILFWWGSIANFMPIFGALLADSYLGRYFVIASGTVVSLMVRIQCVQVINQMF